MKRLILITIAAMMLTSLGINAKKTKQQKIVNPVDMEIRKEIAATPEKSGGIYYAYPYTSDSLPSVPAGFKPVYISHYGRHGSRWHSSDTLHETTVKELNKEFKAGNLTKDGETVLNLVKRCREHTRGHIGELSKLGERQHRGVANRMFARFPMLFNNGDTVVARASQVPRCIMSMAAFNEALKENNPLLVIDHYATPGDMDIIAYHTKAAKAIYKKQQPWKIDYQKKCDSLYRCEKTAARLFKNPEKVQKLNKVMSHLHEVGMDVQDVDGLEAPILTYFDAEDLYNLWKGKNYQQYVRHGKSIDGKSAGPESAENLLKDIIDRTDDALAGNLPKVDLRFGHDVFLMRLLARMDVEGSNATAQGIDEASRVWQDFRLTPMAANLQLVVFRNNAGDEIVTLRLNEQPIKISGVKEYAPGYYRWSDLRTKWEK